MVALVSILVALATVVALGILGVLGAVLTGAAATVAATVAVTVAVLAKAGRWVLRVVPGLAFAFLRAAAVAAVAILAILAVRAMAAPGADKKMLGANVERHDFGAASTTIRDQYMEP